MKLTPRTIGTASAIFLIWPIIEVILKKCTWTDCLSAVGNYSLWAFLVTLVGAVLISFASMFTKK